MRYLLKNLLIGAAMVAALGAGAAQAQVALELEGPITAYDNAPGVRPTLTVMGIPITVRNNTNLTSPTTSRDDLGININQWFRGPRLPGRTERGFIGGTATVTGTVDPVTGEITADEIFAEPAENVLVGVLDSANCGVDPNCIGGSLTALATETFPGVTLIPLEDPRIAFGGLRDDNGFQLTLAGNPVLDGAEFSAEGHFSQTDAEPTHYFHTLELGGTGGDLLLNANEFEVTANRAQCRQRDVNEWEIEVRGATHVAVTSGADPTAGVVGMLDQNGVDIPLDEVAVIDALAEAGEPNIFGGFRIRIDERAGTCPTSVTVTWTNQTIPAESFEVEIRDDTADGA